MELEDKFKLSKQAVLAAIFSNLFATGFVVTFNVLEQQKHGYYSLYHIAQSLLVTYILYGNLHDLVWSNSNTPDYKIKLNKLMNMIKRSTGP